MLQIGCLEGQNIISLEELIVRAIDVRANTQKKK